MADEVEEVRGQPKITVDGTDYELPPLDTFDLDEAMILYKYSELTFDQVFELEGLHPGVVAALLHVAIARNDPSLRDREVRAIVRSINMMNVLEQFAAIEEAMPDPTKDAALSPEPDSSRRSSEDDNSSGDDGSAASEPSQEPLPLASTGSPDSEAPAISSPVISAV